MSNLVRASEAAAAGNVSGNAAGAPTTAPRTGDAAGAPRETALRTGSTRAATIPATGSSATGAARTSYAECSARERLALLLDAGSFHEWLPPAARVTSPHLAQLGVPVAFDDGVAIGTARLDGRPVHVAAQEGGFMGGGVGEVHGAKLVGLLRRALRDRPAAVLLLADSGGVRLHEANAGLIAVSEVMRALLDVRAAGIPTVVLIGSAYGCFGGMGIVARCADHVVMSDTGRHAMSGPEVIEASHGVDEFDARDRALVWRTTGGKHRWLLGDCDQLVEDDVAAFRAAAIRALGESHPPSPVSLEAEHALLTRRQAAARGTADAIELWTRLGVAEAARVPDLGAAALQSMRPAGMAMTKADEEPGRDLAAGQGGGRSPAHPSVDTTERPGPDTSGSITAGNSAARSSTPGQGEGTGTGTGTGTGSGPGQAEDRTVRDAPRGAPSWSALVEALFGPEHDIVIDAEGELLAGTGRLDDRPVTVVGTTHHASIGYALALRQARVVLDTIARHPGRPILLLIDTQGQRLRRHDELLGIHRAMAHLGMCIDLARRRGHRVIGLVYDQALSGGFITSGLIADACDALPAAEIRVMRLPAMARVTKLPEALLAELSQANPVFAPGVDNYVAMGGIRALWRGDLQAALRRALAEAPREDRRAEEGAARGGRLQAAAVMQRVLDAS